MAVKEREGILEVMGRILTQTWVRINKDEVVGMFLVPSAEGDASLILGIVLCTHTHVSFFT